MDLQFANTWDNSAGSRRIRSELIDKDASHTLAYGYKLESTDCKITVASACAGLFPCPVPQSSADKKSVTVTSEDTWPVFTFDFNVDECLPDENTDVAGYNNFCVSKDASKPYCDTNLKKCYGCSIVNNDPSGTSDRPNIQDCDVGTDTVTIGKCALGSGASLGGTCSFASTCSFNNDCSTACCSAENSPGPGESPGYCIKSSSPKNPRDYQPNLCKNA